MSGAHRATAWLLAGWMLFSGVSAAPLEEIQARLSEAETLLAQWQFEPARRIAERLFAEHPDLPAVQWLAGWVKFHYSEHAAALDLMERAAAAFGPDFSDPRLELVRASARLSRGWISQRSPDGRVMVWHAPGVDEVLAPELFDCVRRTLEVVGADLGHQASTPVLVEILPDRQALADATGLPLSDIEGSGTIAVSKYNRLLITSPRSTLTGYSWADTVSHELVHRIVSERTFNRTPIWLHEALARFQDTRWRAGEPLYRAGLSPADESALAAALRQEQLIPFERMHPSMAFLPTPEAARLAFAEVYTVTQFLLERGGYPGLRRLLDEIGRGRSDWEGMQAAFGLDAQSFPRAWLEWLRRQKFVERSGEVALETARSSGPERRFEGGPLLVRDFFHLGQLLDARQRPRAAAVEYRKAADQAGPRHAAAGMLLEKLGRALARIERADEAQRALEHSLEREPLSVEARRTLGEILLPREPYLAWLHLREAARINPLHPGVARGLLRASEALAQNDDRRMDWNELRLRYRRALALLARAGIGEGDAERATPAPAQASAFLRINSVPWAEVWLDFRDTGLTTPVLELAVAPGRHVVTLVPECGPPEVVMVSLSAGERAVIARELCRAEERDGGE
ncbi:MAG: hypothetical protein GYA21_04480 [Myxococcales bacterium]|nr:hypothetical protein [Myxococcales bacterium]